MTIALLASTVVLACSGGGAASTGQQPLDPPATVGADIADGEKESTEPAVVTTTEDIGPQWQELLRCALERGSPCRQLLVDASGRDEDAALARLATALLEEWELDLDHERLSRPRLIWMDLPSLQELEEGFSDVVPYSIIVASGVVGEDGRTTDQRLLRKSDSEWLNMRILEAFREAVFRPAVEDGRFVPKRTEYVYRLHPR